MKTKKIWGLALIIVAAFTLASCSIVRGYRADGKSGPDIYSFEHHVRYTIDNGTFPFRFPYAKQQAIWIATLHFFNQGKHYKNTTLQEAVTGKTDTQGVLIIQNDSIILQRAVILVCTDTFCHAYVCKAGTVMRSCIEDARLSFAAGA